jgi:replicative DNA helicase
MTEYRDSPPMGLWQRMPPSNLHAEQALLGALLANNRAFDRVEFLLPEHFADPINGRIFGIMRSMTWAGELADAVTMRARLEHAGTLDEVGGVGYLAQLLSSMVGIINAGEYGRAVRDCWHRRALIGIGENLVNEAFAGELATAAHEAAEIALFEVAERGQESRDIAYGDAVADVLARSDAAGKRDDGIVGVRTGFSALDRMTCGLQRGDLVLIGARPSMGKTGLMLAIALRAAATGVRVRIQSAEMSRYLLGVRGVSALTGIAAHDIMRGQVATGINPATQRQEMRGFNLDEAGQLVLAHKAVAKLPVELDDVSAPTLAHVRSGTRRQLRRAGCDMLIVDYIGKMRATEGARRQNRNQELTELSGGLKDLAKDLDMPVVALSQLTRDVEKRDDKTPIMSDLRDSGALEQDADVVMFLHRDHYYLSRGNPVRKARETEENFNLRVQEWQDAGAKALGRADIFIAKQRMGPTGRVRLRFHDDIAWFSDESDADRRGPLADAMPKRED